MITPAQSVTQSTAQPPTAAKSRASALTSDFETFLLMLTAQARNQDPLEPLDSSEYASQLAQFLMVEQQVQTNDLLTSLAMAMTGANPEQLANWVGMDVRSASALQFDGQPVTLFVEPEPAADQTLLVIQNAEGAVLQRKTLPVTETELDWAGVEPSGNPLPSGSYSATLESYKSGELISRKLASAYTRVVEAQVAEGTVLLILESGAAVPAGDVTGIRTGA